MREVDAESLANLPASVDGSRYRWLDLDGEGLQCILAEERGAWFYKRNLTPLSLMTDSGQPEATARFEALTEVSELPAPAQAGAGRHQFLKLSGDGHLDCAVLERPGAEFLRADGRRRLGAIHTALESGAECGLERSEPSVH